MATVDLAAREAWRQQRRTGVGASEAAAAIGINPYKPAIELWAEKCGLVDAVDLSENEAVEFGVRLEPVIADAYAERTGRQVTLWDQTRSVRHQDLPFLFCTPDAIQTVPDADGISNVQIKTAGAFLSGEWQEGAPLHYEVQVQVEMFCLGFRQATLVVLIGGQKLRYFDLQRNDRFLAALVPKLEEFWRCVQTRTPPAVDGSQACAKALLKLHPLDSGESVALPPEAIEWDAELQDAKVRAKELDAFITERENRLKAAIADGTFGVLPDGTRYSWKHQHRDSYVVKETDVRVLRKLKR